MSITGLLAKRDSNPLELDQILIIILGISIAASAATLYPTLSPVLQVIVLIIYLGTLVGVAPIPMPVFKSKFGQTVFAGIISGVLDSFIVLLQCKTLKTRTEDGNETLETEGERAKLLALMTLSALIGGLIIWFGEVYAAGLYNNDGRTGVLSALFIVPPVLVFLSILGFHASKLKVSVIKDESKTFSLRDLLEFSAGIVGLLLCHNPLLCLGVLIIYSIITRQGDHLIDVWKHETEVGVMAVLLIALFAGDWIVSTLVVPHDLNQGALLPIIPATIQAVLWGPLYYDPDTTFWVRIATLSTGALILPISSLVGVMLFSSLKQWLVFMRYSIPYAVLWYCIMMLWIRFALDTPVGHFLEQWAHSGGHH